jgi:hypothetical protein
MLPIVKLGENASRVDFDSPSIMHSTVQLNKLGMSRRTSLQHDNQESYSEFIERQTTLHLGKMREPEDMTGSLDLVCDSLAADHQELQ